MGKQAGQTSHLQFTDDFKREAVRILETSGRRIGEAADDLGIGKSARLRADHSLS